MVKKFPIFILIVYFYFLFGGKVSSYPVKFFLLSKLFKKGLWPDKCNFKVSKATTIVYEQGGPREFCEVDRKNGTKYALPIAVEDVETMRSNSDITTDEMNNSINKSE